MHVHTLHTVHIGCRPVIGYVGEEKYIVVIRAEKLGNLLILLGSTEEAITGPKRCVLHTWWNQHPHLHTCLSPVVCPSAPGLGSHPQTGSCSPPQGPLRLEGGVSYLGGEESTFRHLQFVTLPDSSVSHHSSSSSSSIGDRKREVSLRGNLLSSTEHVDPHKKTWKLQQQYFQCCWVDIKIQNFNNCSWVQYTPPRVDHIFPSPGPLNAKGPGQVTL